MIELQVTFDESSITWMDRYILNSIFYFCVCVFQEKAIPKLLMGANCLCASETGLTHPICLFIAAMLWNLFNNFIFRKWKNVGLYATSSV